MLRRGLRKAGQFLSVNRPGTLLITSTESTLWAQGLDSPPKRAVFGVLSAPA
jgi:hypothetical protein